MFQEIRVKTELNNVYKEYGKSCLHRGTKNDPDSMNTLETISRRKAYRALESGDRVKINKMIDNFCDKTGFGTDAALMVLMRLGVFFNACEKKIVKTVR